MKILEFHSQVSRKVSKAVDRWCCHRNKYLPINSASKPRAIGSTIEAPKDVCVSIEQVKIIYSTEQRVFIVLEYHIIVRSPTATMRSFQKRFNVVKRIDLKPFASALSNFNRQVAWLIILWRILAAVKLQLLLIMLSQFLELFSKIQGRPSENLQQRLL